MGVRRLAIVDVVHGKQPVWSDDGEIVAVFNGEIFNHRELRGVLKERGHHFRTDCDAELIPALYQQFGAGFVERLNGQFAIGLYDLRKKIFHAWRDRLGICPFFYLRPDPTSLVFGSEIKAIAALPGFTARLDPLGLDQSITFPGPVSPVTLFEGVSSLPPGCWLSMALGQAPHIDRYWRMSFEEASSAKDEDALAEELESLLLDAVRLRIADETPTGLYLSGGLDSSLVGAMMRSHMTNDALDVFSIDFEDSAISEGMYQEEMADHLAVKRHVRTLDAQGICDRLERAVWHTETALRETFNTASLALSEMAHEKAYKVVLAGQGADELFAGYVGYRFDAGPRRTTPQRSNAETEANLALWGDPDFTYERRYYQFDEVRRKLYSKTLRERFESFNCRKLVSLRDDIAPAASRLQRRSFIDTRIRLSEHLLAGHGDRMAMANSVEVRYPMLDPRIIDFALRLPDGLKLKGMTEKYLIKKIGARWVPEMIVKREKFGFTASGSPMLLRLNDARINYCLSREKIEADNVFDWDEVERLVKVYRADGFRINVPFDTDLLITVITYGMLSIAFKIAPIG